jgi:hypothetical protein
MGPLFLEVIISQVGSEQLELLKEIESGRLDLLKKLSQINLYVGFFMC